MFSIFNFRNYHFRNFDIGLILMVSLLSAIGILAIGSAEPTLQNKQIFGCVSGSLIMLFLAFVDYHFTLKFYWVMYVLNLVLLGAVILFGESSHNAQRWLKIGGLQFQPSELAKILLIFFFAAFIMKYKEKINSISFIGLCIALLAIPVALVLKQPDLVLAQFLLSRRFTLAEKIRTFDFYEKYTTGDSSLSHCIMSIMAAQTGNGEKALDYFNKTVRMDIDDVNGNSRDGIHTACMAGSWMSVVYGFAGFKDYGGEYSFNPQLPKEWKKLSPNILRRRK